MLHQGVEVNLLGYKRVKTLILELVCRGQGLGDAAMCLMTNSLAGLRIMYIYALNY